MIASSVAGLWLGSEIAQGYAVHGRAAFTIELAGFVIGAVLAGLAS